MLIFGDLWEVIESHHLRIQTLLLPSLFRPPPPALTPHPHLMPGKEEKAININ